MCLALEHDLQVRLAEHLSEVSLEVGVPCQLCLVIFYILCLRKLREEPEGGPGCLSLQLPSDILVTRNDFINVLSWRFKVLWKLHIEQYFEHLDPGSKRVVLSEERTEHQLIGDVENLDDVMQNCQSLVVVQLCHLCLANLTKCWTDLLHDVEEGLALLVQLKLELFGKTKQGNTPRQDALIVSRVQGIGDVIGQGLPALRIVNPTDHDNAPDVLLRDQAIRHLVHLRDNVRSNVLLVRV